MEPVFDRDFWLLQPSNTLGYKVARTLEDQDLDDRYSGQNVEELHEYVDSRMLLCHDIYHLVLDFPMNPIGEVGLHAALFAQNRYPRAVPIIAGVLMSQKTQAGIDKVIEMCISGYKKGMSMKDLFDVDWSYFLGEDLESVRAHFTI